MTEAWTPKTANCATTGRTVANLGGAAPYWTSYTYNAAGQRATEKQNTATPVTRTYCYHNPRTHAVKTTTTDGNCTDETTRYTYDATGNTTARVETAGSTATQSLTWSAEGKLTKLTEGTATTDYLYDADGQLLIRRASGTTGETVLYLGATEVHLKGTKRWANRYYTAAGSPIALRTNETGAEKLHFLAADHHATGNLSITADSTQALTKRYTSPFGAARGATSGTWPDDKTFLGKPADTGTNLTHIGAREYDPTLGQFISVDPILSLDQHQSVNGYSYVNQHPATTSDPTGLREMCGAYGNSCTPATSTYAPQPSPGEGQGSNSGTASTSGSGDSSASTGFSRCSSLYCGGGGGGATANVPVIGPRPVDLPYIPSYVASPEYLQARDCSAMPIDLVCNPQDAVLGGGEDGLVKIGTKWALGGLERSVTYGEDSAVAKQVMGSDVTSAQRVEIAKAFILNGRTEDRLNPNSIAAGGDAKGQFARDIASMLTGDHNVGTAVMGSYTAKYKILRANARGLQARITIENSMTVSSFAHVATGYGTPSERFIQRWFDNDGVIAFGGAMKSHDMKIVFRTTVYF
ncbi:RHS repeat domain-containing protein [Streptomyces sp. NPDC057193]|uniref:RHS repeat domain-containing protein n=1 Tax=Streptomyces sp. NPDC057193 TaxID=3346043 RepID=UPI003626CCF1